MPNHPFRDSRLRLGLILFWILFILGGYYYYHKPIQAVQLAAPLNAALDILFLILFAGLAGGVGRRLLRAESRPPLERATIQFALGAGVFSLLWLGLGALRLYRYPLAVPLLLLGVLLFQRDVRAWYAQFQGLAGAWQSAGRLEKTLGGMVVLLVSFQLGIALAPPTKWDALTYHLQLPRQYLAAGGLVLIPENPYWGHPQVVEMLYTFAMSFHRAETAAVLGWGSGVIFLLGLLEFTSTQLARLKAEPGTPLTAGWMAVTAVAAGLTFRALMGWAYTDLFAAVFGLAACMTFFAWLDERRSHWFLWCGVFCGLALGVKWTEGLLPVGLFSAAVLFARPNGLKLKTWLLSGGILLAIISPWLLKNTLATGNPLYPYGFSTPWVSSARMAAANLPSENIDWVQHLFAPLTSTLAGVDSAEGFSADLGPLLLLFAVPGLWRYRHRPQTQTLILLLAEATFSLGILSLRFGHLQQTRLYFALLSALAVPCGWGWEWLQHQIWQGVRMRRIAGAMVFLVLGLALWQDCLSMTQLSPARIVFGTETRPDYLENTLGDHIRAMQSLKELPASAHILMLWEPRGLYAPLNAQADLWIDRWRTDRRELQTSAAIRARWQQQGFTHLLIYTPGIELLRPSAGQTPSADWTVLQEMQMQLNRRAPPQAIGDHYLLYTLK